MIDLQLSYRFMRYTISPDDPYMPGGPVGWYPFISANAMYNAQLLDYWERRDRVMATIRQSIATIEAIANDDAPVSNRTSRTVKLIGGCLDEVAALPPPQTGL